jgi:nucleotidyltransferase substrate binding protein (TIGR01987 family)
MEIVKQRYASLLQALASLNKSIEMLKKYPETVDVDLHETCRDSCIQRFEYTFDAFWKFIKLYLEECEKIELESSSPRHILKAAENLDLFLQYENLGFLLEALSHRNLTSHSYSVQTAEKIVSEIPLYYQTMHAITIELGSKIV